MTYGIPTEKLIVVIPAYNPDKRLIHLVEEIRALWNPIVLGIRKFDGRDVPNKSKWGNKITSAVFGIQTGIQKLDTQTGLRGIPHKYAEVCGRIRGERFEFEMNMLLQMAKENVTFIKVSIKTVYMEQNRSSGFRPLWDSMRIYWIILKFGFSSFVCAGIDFSSFAVFSSFLFPADATGIMISTITARMISGLCNFSSINILFSGTKEME